MIISGLVGFVLKRNGFGPAPIIMGIVLGGGPMQVVNEAQYLIDVNKSPWKEPDSPLKQRLRELGEAIPKGRA